MPKQNAEALKLPDQLLVRYFRAGEIDEISAVSTDQKDRVRVTVKLPAATRTDRWRDLGGGLGFIPSDD